jgi:hypothetical protein
MTVAPHGRFPIGEQSTFANALTSPRFLASANGSAAAPSVRVGTDADTGLYYDATKGVVTAVDGVDRLAVMANGTDIQIRSTAAYVNLLMTNTATTRTITSFAGTPEGAITASPGSVSLDTTNGKLYIKASGTGTNTGWREISPSTAGTYTPILGAITNVDSVTVQGSWQYTRTTTGSVDVIRVSGIARIDPTASGAVIISATLPVASNFTSATQAPGQVTTQGVSGYTYSDATNDYVLCVSSNTATAAYDFNISFSYVVV